MSSPAQAPSDGAVNSKQSTVKGSVRHFTQLEAWKVNHEAALQIYKTTKKWPKEERFGLIDQIRRAAASVTANIAEAWGRFHFADKKNFYYQARGSNSEVQNFLLLAKDLGYLKESEFSQIYERVQGGLRLLSGLIRSTERRRIQ